MILAAAFPGWLNFVIAASALLTALGVLWRLVVRPGAEIITQMNQLKPLLIDQIDAFGGEQGTFKVLADMAAEFRTNGGSTLRDVVDRIESTAKTQGDAILAIQASMETMRALAAADREHLASLGLQTAELTEWRKDRQKQAVHDAQTAERMEIRMVAAEKAAAKVIADNDPATNLPTVRPTPLAPPGSREETGDVASAKVLADNDPVTDLPTVRPTGLPVEQAGS